MTSQPINTSMRHLTWEHEEVCTSLLNTSSSHGHVAALLRQQECLTGLEQRSAVGELADALAKYPLPVLHPCSANILHGGGPRTEEALRRALKTAHSPTTTMKTTEAAFSPSSSPFRFCASASFHQHLRACAASSGLNQRRLRMEGLCHTERGSRSRGRSKRSRSTTTTTMTAGRMADGERRHPLVDPLPSGTSLASSATTTSNNAVPGSLAARVDESLTLLEELLQGTSHERDAQDQPISIISARRDAPPQPCPSPSSAAGGRLASPPRTVFLFGQSPPPPSSSQAATSPPRMPSPTPPPPPLPLPPRLLDSPDDYLEELRRSAKASSRAASSVPPEPSSTRWQLLVDHRERTAGTHQGMTSLLEAKGVPYASCTLPCGDFVINVDATPNNTPTTTEVVLASSMAEKDCGGGDALPPTQLYEHLLPVVVERKTIMDLDASVKSSRYHQQRHLLAASPFHQVLWLVEGVGPRAFSHGRGGAAASAATAEQVAMRVSSACATLGSTAKMSVIRTRSVEESMLFLKALAERGVHSLGRAPTLHKNNLCGAVVPRSLPLGPCLDRVAALHQSMRDQTVFPRMLLCMRGCTTPLAALITRRYGSLYAFWKHLRRVGRQAYDRSDDLRGLTLPQRKTLVLLTEFLLAEEYL